MNIKTTWARVILATSIVSFILLFSQMLADLHKVSIEQGNTIMKLIVIQGEQEVLINNTQIELQENKKQLEEIQKEIQIFREERKTMKAPTRGTVSREIHAIATAYGATVLNGGAGTGKTSTGDTPIEGRTVAVDPKKIPIGSTVRITCDSYPEVNGEYVAEDKGAAIKENRIDIYMDDLNIDPYVARAKMLEFGRRKVIIEVLE